jgi:hypothetical protein
MIVWSGWGAAIVLAGAIAGSLIAAIGPAVGHAAWITAALTILGGLVAGGIIFAISRWIENRPGRTLVDQATGQTIVWRKSAGSLFFIPTRFWAAIAPAIYIVSAIYPLVHTAMP